MNEHKYGIRFVPAKKNHQPPTLSHVRLAWLVSEFFALEDARPEWRDFLELTVRLDEPMDAEDLANLEEHFREHGAADLLSVFSIAEWNV